ncbi:MAG: serine/threonine protein kinase [Phycisphaerales bacterium JB063]
MAETTQTNLDSVVGRFVVEKGLATSEEVNRCLAMIKDSSSGSDVNQSSLSELLIQQGVVTRAQINRIKPEVEEQKENRQIPGYQILSKLGAGAMATVYKARQLSLDRIVAIKVLPQKHSKDTNFIQRFYDEGKAAAKLNHPNIVGAYDVGQAGNFHYFVMEFVDGRTVYDDISKHGAYSEEDALKIAIQVTQALTHAHAAGFIHRDVKPKNIMISNSGTVKLADMGLARAVSDREAAEAEQGKAYGTPYYISPEQIRGEVEIDFRADIYAMGATLYHMVTGRVPFEGPNPSAVMHRHLKDDLVPPDHINTKLTSGISEIIEVAMAKSARKRFATTEDLLHDLEQVARGEKPTIARKMFDISSLAALDTNQAQMATFEPDYGNTPLMGQPLFWPMVLGWLSTVLLLLILLAFVLSQ